MQSSPDTIRSRAVVAEAANTAFRARLEKAKEATPELRLLSLGPAKHARLSDFTPQSFRHFAEALRVSPRWLAIGAGPMEVTT